jgi:lipid A 3-O-deacylase
MGRIGPGAAALAALMLAASSGGAFADDGARFGLIEENDSLYFHTDKHYTQGIRFSVLGPSRDAAAWPFAFLGAHTPVFADAPADRRISYFLGQSVFTPRDLKAKPPDPHDRPYAGWLYGGVSLLQRSRDGGLENVELALGIVGPGAFGKFVQNDWHQFIGIPTARGWASQLQNEPGAVLSYDRLWRVTLAGSDAFGIDVVPQAGATFGNVYTYGDAGGLLRIGSKLGADYGPARVRPALSGTDYFDANAAGEAPGGYFYVGALGRVVARNLFLDGNNFRMSPSVEHKALVADVQSGMALFWSRHVKLDLSVVLRTQEFVGQHTPDVLGTATLAFTP